MTVLPLRSKARSDAMCKLEVRALWTGREAVPPRLVEREVRAAHRPGGRAVGGLLADRVAARAAAADLRAVAAAGGAGAVLDPVARRGDAVAGQTDRGARRPGDEVEAALLGDAAGLRAARDAV